MMRKLKHALAHTTCVTVLLVFGTGSAWSEQEPKDNQANPWDMSPTAAPFTTPDSSISVGVGYLDGERQQLGIFDGQRSSHGSLLFDAKIIKRDEATGTWITTQGRNLGMDYNREVKVDLERQGEWGIRVDYNEIPRVTPYSVNSKTEGLGTTTQIIPKTTTSGDGATVQIKTDRERVTLNTFRALHSKIKFNLNFRNETKEGTRQWGRGGFNEFALEPVDWTMRQLEPTLSFTGDQLQLLGGYNGSWFRNENNLVDIIRKGDNPATLANHTYLTLPLNNEAHQIFLGGGYNFTSDTRGTFKISYARALQNEHIPTTDITGLTTPNAPSSLQGRVDNTLLQLGLTTQPMPKLSLTAKLRYYDENDKTPAWLVADFVNTTTKAQTQIHSTPLSNRTITGQMEGSYRLPYQSTLTGGVERKEQKRQVPYGNDIDKDGLDDERFVPWRTELDETTYRLQIGRNLSETLNGSLGFEHAIRTGSHYLNSIKIMGNSQGKISPFFIADRERDKLRFAADWRPIERLGFQFNVENALDRYGPEQEPYGQQKSNTQLYSMDMDYAPTDNLLLTAWYSYDLSKTWQESGRWSATGVREADKNSILTDQGNSFGLGVRNQWNDHLKLGANYQHSRAKSSYADSVSVDPKSTAPAYPVGMTPLPDITSPTTRINTFVEYKGLGPGLLRCDFIHEQWRTNDWTWQFSDGSSYTYGANTSGVTTDGTVISTTANQSSNFFGIRYTTSFQ